MVRRAANLALPAGTALSILLAVSTTLSIAGLSKTVWVAVGVTVLAVAPAILGLWLVDRNVRSRYVTSIKEEPIAEFAALKIRRPELRTDEHADSAIRMQVVPAFSELGIEGTHKVFLQLISELDDLPGDERDDLLNFVNRTVVDSHLNDQQKIEQIIFHFAPRAAESHSKSARTPGPTP